MLCNAAAVLHKTVLLRQRPLGQVQQVDTTPDGTVTRLHVRRYWLWVFPLWRRIIAASAIERITEHHVYLYDDTGLIMRRAELPLLEELLPRPMPTPVPASTADGGTSMPPPGY
ncbi:hypothetical protein H6771_02310 [Candidatus Peribacteria bacterium]|nr:hypothetical protein [Candidatus Peribacteria bacterium]